MSEPTPPTNKALTKQDRYASLARMVADVSQDHTRLRLLIYEFARVKLRRDLYGQFVDGAWAEINEQVQGLENAIDRIEFNFTRPASPAPSRLPSPNGSGKSPAHESSLRSFGWQEHGGFGEEAIRARSLVAYSAHDRMPALPIALDDRLANAVLGKHLRSKFWRNTEVFFAVAIGIAICATIGPQMFVNRLGLSKWVTGLTQIAMTNDASQNVKERPSSTKNGERAPSAIARIPSSGERVDEHPSSTKSGEPALSSEGIPVPAEYGVYAVVDGRLAELEELQLKAPDPRVAISAMFSTPSRTHLPSGKVEFVIFRRDFANSAPDRVSARIVARVNRVMTFDHEGHAKTAGVDESWVIRSNAYQLRVGPFGDNPEMVLVHADTTSFAFPSGRYALILKGVGYDFTVDGPVTDGAHCLERTMTLGAPVYSECRTL